MKHKVSVYAANGSKPYFKTADVILASTVQLIDADVWLLPAVTLMGEKSLVLVQEPHHKYLRALLQPAFSKEAVHSYLPAIEALVLRHLTSWEDKGEALAGPCRQCM